MKKTDNKISEIAELPMTHKVYAVDLDGTLCSPCDDYSKATPYKQRIEIINKLYKLGHKIIIYTGRGGITGIDWTDITKKQLKKWGVKYHELKFKAFYYDYWIDDRACNAMPFFGELAHYHLDREGNKDIHELAFVITGYDVYGQGGIIKWM